MADFEYYIKSSSPGSLSSKGNSGFFSAQAELNIPVVSLGLASCDFSLDSMVRETPSVSTIR